MSEFNLKAEADRLMLAMQFVSELRLEEILSTVEAAHTLGPILDPTKYRDALQRGDMDALRDLARALLPAVAIFRERVLPRAREEWGPLKEALRTAATEDRAASRA